jgi:hypothetical protein
LLHWNLTSNQTKYPHFILLRGSRDDHHWCNGQIVSAESHVVHPHSLLGVRRRRGRRLHSLARRRRDRIRNNRVRHSPHKLVRLQRLRQHDRRNVDLHNALKGSSPAAEASVWARERVRASENVGSRNARSVGAVVRAQEELDVLSFRRTQVHHLQPKRDAALVKVQNRGAQLGPRQMVTTVTTVTARSGQTEANAVGRIVVVRVGHFPAWLTAIARFGITLLDIASRRGRQSGRSPARRQRAHRHAVKVFDAVAVVARAASVGRREPRREVGRLIDKGKVVPGVHRLSSAKAGQSNGSRVHQTVRSFELRKSSSSQPVPVRRTAHGASVDRSLAQSTLTSNQSDEESKQHS